jgi:hypothetical protein
MAKNGFILWCSYLESPLPRRAASWGGCASRLEKPFEGYIVNFAWNLSEQSKGAGVQTLAYHPKSLESVSGERHIFGSPTACFCVLLCDFFRL